MLGVVTMRKKGYQPFLVFHKLGQHGRVEVHVFLLEGLR